MSRLIQTQNRPCAESVSNNRTVPMSRHTRGLRAGTDGRAQQAQVATGEHRSPAGWNRRLRRRWGRGLRGRTDRRAGTSNLKQGWADLADRRAGRRTAQIKPKSWLGFGVARFWLALSKITPILLTVAKITLVCMAMRRQHCSQVSSLCRL